MKIKEKTKKDIESGFDSLRRRSFSHISLNTGILCNQECTHCHLKAGPDKKDEVMEREIIGKLVEFIDFSKPDSLEITGGAPELNGHIIDLIGAVRPLVREISMRTNLTAMQGDDSKKLISFLYNKNISLVASLPCYTKDKVDLQRGKGVFGKSINVLSRLNSIGFGVGGGVPITLVYNQTDLSLPPAQEEVKKEFKERLAGSYGIEFTDLITMINVPIGRFASSLKKEGNFEDYIRSLRENYNPDNLSKLMCINQVTIDWKGRFYDCDFNLALDLPQGGWSSLDSFKDSPETGSRIYTGYHCLSCTAGTGSSCHGSLTK